MSTAPQSRSLPLSDGAVHLREWGGPGDDAPHLVFLHATGMCASVYDSLLAPLASVARVTAYDARGHGLTSLPADPATIPDDWRIYRQDLAAVVAAIGGGPVLLAGHSMGAATALEAAVDQPGLASRLLLIDPPFIPAPLASAYRQARESGHMPPNPMAERAARRSVHFPSREAARAAWNGRGVFAGWPDRALDAYCAGALLDAPGGGVDLACRPAWEAATYLGVSTSFEASVTRATIPFALLAAEQGSPVDPGAEDRIRAARPSAAIYRLAGTGHFLPITHADPVRSWLYGLVSGDFPLR